MLPKGTATLGLAIRERQPITTPDVLSDPRITLAPESQARIERSGYRSVLAVRLLIRGHAIGGLAVGDVEGRIFTGEEVRLVERFTAQAAIAIENARLYAEERIARNEAEEANRAKDDLPPPTRRPGARVGDRPATRRDAPRAITAASEGEGRGATFTVTLPIMAMPAPVTRSRPKPHVDGEHRS